MIVTADFDGVGTGLSNDMGAIIDNLAGEGANIVADQLALRAGSGIGDGVAADPKDLDLMVNTLAAVTESGDIHLQNHLQNSEALVIGTFDSLSGVTISDSLGNDSTRDDVTIRAASRIDVTVNHQQAVVNNDGGDITLTVGADLAINAAINAGTGSLWLEVAGDGTQTISGTITAFGLALVVDGDVTLVSNNAVDVLAASVGGDIRFEPENVTIGRVEVLDGQCVLVGSNKPIAIPVGMIPEPEPLPTPLAVPSVVETSFKFPAQQPLEVSTVNLENSTSSSAGPVEERYYVLKSVTLDGQDAEEGSDWILERTKSIQSISSSRSIWIDFQSSSDDFLMTGTAFTFSKMATSDWCWISSSRKAAPSRLRSRRKSKRLPTATRRCNHQRRLTIPPKVTPSGLGRTSVEPTEPREEVERLPAEPSPNDNSAAPQPDGTNPVTAASTSQGEGPFTKQLADFPFIAWRCCRRAATLGLVTGTPTEEAVDRYIARFGHCRD